MVRWHFENCKLAPNPSEQSIQDRAKLKERFKLMNKKHPKNQVADPENQDQNDG
jgi:hypothetical protein